MKTKKKNSFGKRILSTVLAIATAISGFTFTPVSSNTVEAEAAASDIGSEIASAALAYLGYGYATGGDGTNGTFDCTGLIERAMEDVGFENVPTYTGAWESAITGKSLNLTYNGETFNYVYVDTIADYNDAVASPSSSNTVVVLKTGVSSDTLYNSANMTAGTILISAEESGNAAHGMIYLTDVTQPSVTATNFTSKYYEYSQTAVSTIASTFGNVNTSAAKYVGEYSSASGSQYLSWTEVSGVSRFSSKQSYYMVHNGNADGNTLSLGSSTWLVDAASTDYGVRLTNKIGGKSGSASTVYLVSIPPTTSEYYGEFQIQKVDEDGNSVSTSGIQFNVYDNAACTSLVDTIETTSSGLATFTTGKLSSSDAVTYYVKEVASSVPSGMTANTNVYKVTITPGTQKDYSDCSIQVWYGSTGSDATTSVTVTDSIKFSLANTHKTFYGGFAIQKVDDSGKAVTSNASGIVFNVYTTYSNGTLSGKVDTLTTGSNGKTGSYTCSWESDTAGSNTTATYYVKEDASASAAALNRLNMDADTDVYQVVITGSTSSAAASTIAVTNKTNSSKSVSVTNSTSTISYFNYGNTQLTTYTVTKSFGSNTGNKVTNVTVYLYADGVYKSSYVLTEADNNWSHTFTELPMYGSNGNTITYTSEEKYVSYTDVTGTLRSNVAYSTAQTIFTISNGGVASSSGVITNTLKTESYPVMKILDGDAGDYIESVEYTLYANSTNLSNAKIDTVTLDDSNDWSYTFTYLDSYDYKGADITYSAVETKVTLKSGKTLTSSSSTTTSRIDNYFTVTSGTKTVSSTTYNTKTNTLITLYGGFAIKKDNSENSDVTVGGTVYTIYSDAACTKAVTSIKTNADGLAVYTTNWYKIDALQKTYYVKETSVPEPYVLDDTVYTVVVTGSADGVASSTISVTASGSNVSATVMTVGSVIAQGYTQDNDEQYGQITITKYGEIVTGFSGTSFSGDGTVVTGYTNGSFTYEYKVMAGATFELYAAEDIDNEAGTIHYDEGDLVETLTTGSDGTLTFGVATADCPLGTLPLGTYRIVEVEAPDGQTIPDTHEWTVTLSYKGQSYSVSSISMPVRDTLGNATVSLVKIDGDTKNALEGAYYGLYAASDIVNSEGTVIAAAGTLISVVKTDENGEGEFLNGSGDSIDIPYGDYYVQEIQTRDGYIYSDEKYEFTFSQPGTTTPASNAKQFSYTFTDERMTGTISIIKEDAVTGGTAQGDATLEGAIYGLYAKEDIIHPDGKTGVVWHAGDLVDTLVTGADGYAETDGLYLGKYYVQEIKPSEGYLIDYTQYDITVVSEGPNNKTTEVTVGRDYSVIFDLDNLVTDYVIKRAFAIQKVTTGEEDETMLEGLIGAGFTVYLVSDLVYNQDGSVNYDASPKTVITADGSYEVFTDNVYESGELVQVGYAETIAIPYGTYLVHESTVPTDKLKVNDFTVTISKTDTYTDSNGNSYENKPMVKLWYYLFDDTFSAKIRMIKVDANTGEEVVLSGATFKIYDVDNEEYIGYYELDDNSKTVWTETWTTNDEGYAITSKSLTAGTYRIEEIQAPEGFYNQEIAEGITSTFTITIGTGFTFEGNDVDTYYDEQLGCYILPIVYTDEEVRGTIEVTKSGEVLDSYDTSTGTFKYVTAGLPNATYTVYAAENIYSPDNGSLIWSTNDVVGTIVTDDDGYGKLENLNLGTYYIKETKAPEGYLISDEIQYATLAYAGQTVKVVYDTDGTANSFFNDRPTYDISVVKYEKNEDGTTNYNTVLEGTGFSFITTTDIVNYKGETIVTAGTVLANVVTGADGKATVPTEIDLPYGSYQFVETSVPAGYVLDSTPINAVYGYQGQNTRVITVACEQANHYIKVEISKEDIETLEAVVGAELAIYSVAEDGTETLYDTWVSDGTAYRINRIPAGTYIIRELSAPGYYVCADDITIVVEAVAVVQGYTMYDDFTKIQIDKVDEETGDMVVGATLELYVKNADGSRGELIDSWTSDGTGHYIERLVKGDYILVETSAPDVYVCAEDMIITVIDTPDVQYFEMEDPVTKTDISKTDITTGEEIEGAVLTIYKKNDDGTKGEKVASWTTDGTPHRIERLSHGDYILVEDYAPGCYVTSQEVTFTVTDENIILKVNMVDDFTKADFAKVDIETGKYVVGAVLALYTTDDQGNKADLVEQWTTDGTLHRIERLDKGTYILSELSAPGCYVTADDMEVVIGDTPEVQTFTMKDDITKIQILKVDIETGEPVVGAAIEMYKLNDDGSRGDFVTSWTTDGTAHYMERVDKGDYILIETYAPGYYVSGEFTFTVEDTPEVQTFTMTDDFTKVAIEKVDIETGEPVIGAVLSLYKLNDDGTKGDRIDTWVVEEKPYYIERLEKGDYILVENLAPGYYVTSEDMIFTVEDTPEVQTFTMYDGITKLLISKTDIVTGEEVVGAVLSIYKRNADGTKGDLVVTWTSTEEPYYIERLDKGTYILVEEYAPDEYVTAQDITFIVDDTGEIQVVEMVDKITQVLISKTDIVTEAEVEGATLSIYTANDDGTKGELVETWTSTTRPHYIERLKKGDYILVEEYAPGCYVTAQEVYFTVEDTESIQLVEMVDDFTKVEIAKVDAETGEYVVGAKLELYTMNDDGTKGELVTSWTTTAEAHYIERLDKGTYIVHETYAPGCYVTAEDITIEVVDTSEVQTFTMEDGVTHVEISKTDLVDSEEVPGATLTVYKVEDDGTRTLVETWVTDGEPHTIDRLDKGTYVLVEENTPDGYQIAEEVTFEVTDTGEIQKVEMKDARTYGKVVVNKTDENGNPLAGVEFTITNKDTGEVVDVITTDENGYAESIELPIDDRAEDQSLVLINYTIQETKTASADYVLDDTVTEFTFKYVDDKTPVVTYAYGATNELQKGRIAVMKKGLAAVGTTTVETVYGDVEKLVYDYIYLPGVEFTIYADEDLTEVVAVITTNDNGAAYSDYLPVGTYYVVETYTPAGYVADDTVYTVNITGDGTGNLYVLDVTKDIVNHPCSVTINIYKEGSFLVSTESGYEERTEALEGVVIGIYAAEDITNYIGDVVITKGTLIAVLVTDENGLATMTETLPTGSYYYKELKALDGYVLDTTEYEFEVSYENDNAVLDVNKENPLMNYIQSGTLTVNKVDQDGNPLGAGVEFLVTCVDTGETWTIVTDANGVATLTGLAIGAYDENGTWTYYTYTLQETKTLDNYKLDDTVYTWQFTADNTNAEAVYQTFTVRNVILGIVDYSMAGGVSMLMLAFVLVLMAIRKKKEEEEEMETVSEDPEI